jgi:hypothetical protein
MWIFPHLAGAVHVSVKLKLIEKQHSILPRFFAKPLN